jgi:hypothetical protein
MATSVEMKIHNRRLSSCYDTAQYSSVIIIFETYPESLLPKARKLASKKMTFFDNVMDHLKALPIFTALLFTMVMGQPQFCQQFVEETLFYYDYDYTM